MTPKTLVHLLKGGFALCGRPGPPHEWEAHEKWVSWISVGDDDLERDMLCERCLAVSRGQPVPESIGLDGLPNYVRLLSDETGTLCTCWCQRCNDTFKFYLPCSARLAAGTFKLFLKEHDGCKPRP